VFSVAEERGERSIGGLEADGESVAGLGGGEVEVGSVIDLFWSEVRIKIGSVSGSFYFIPVNFIEFSGIKFWLRNLIVTTPRFVKTFKNLRIQLVIFN